MHHMQSTNAMLHHIMLYMYMNFTDVYILHVAIDFVDLHV